MSSHVCTEILCYIIFAIHSDGQPGDASNQHKVLRSTSSVLTFCFLIECIMKMIAFSPYGYWQSRRNRMDMFVTILGVAWIILDHLFYNTITLTLGNFMIKIMKIE